MDSLNFEFLRPQYSELADLGAFAELYASSDPSSAGVKLRGFAELLTGAIYEKFRFARPRNRVCKNAHCARVQGRGAARCPEHLAWHAQRRKSGCPRRRRHSATSNRTPRRRVQVVALVVDHGPWQEGGQSPGVPSASCVCNRRGIGCRRPRSFYEGEGTRGQGQRTRRAAPEYEEIAQQAEQLAALQAEGQKTADLLHLTEHETRQRLIDRDLARAGWKVGYNGTNTAEVTQEQVLVNSGRADYVLWDDNGKPLAVIEAKKTSRDVEAGRKQAIGYANALETQYGQRPVIFTANGHDITIWDDAQGYPPRPLFGFYSKDSLQYRVYQRGAKKQLAEITVDPAITNRLYQIEAIRRVSERFTERRRRTLLVQATGTGKTRVAISLTDVLMRAGWVKRVLFLCDRTELRKQAKNAFSEFLKEPLVILDSGTQQDRNARIYLATYPALDGFFQNFDPGYFDLPHRRRIPS